MNHVPRSIRRFARRFTDAGHELYIVGGAVRDGLLGRTVTDYDFATSATPDEVQRLFRRTIPTGVQHGTVTVLFEGSQFEVTTYRVDGTYADHRHPDAVHFTRSLDEDLARRDLTINAIAMDPASGRIHDPHGGREDLRRRLVRTVGDPDTRFGEDALRMLRAVRFATALEFDVDPALRAAVARHHAEITTVAAERVLQEFEKMMAASRPSTGWRLLRDTHLLEDLIPELLEGDRPPAGAAAVDGLFDHLVASCDCAPRDHATLRWAALFHDLAKPRCSGHDDRGRHFHGHDERSAEMATAILTRLRASRERIEGVRHLVRHHMFGVHGDSTDAAIRRFVSRVGTAAAADLLVLRRADICGKTGAPPTDPGLLRLEERVTAACREGHALTVRDLAVNGRDLMTELRISPGPIVGILLDELLETVLDNPEQNTRDQLLTIARRFADSRLDTQTADDGGS